MEMVRMIAGCVLLAVGLIFFLVEVIGVFHMEFVLNRMHAAGMGDTMGLGASLLGLMLINGLNMGTLKMLFIVVFMWFTSPVASHLIAELDAATDPDVDKFCSVETDLKSIGTETQEKEEK